MDLDQMQQNSFNSTPDILNWERAQLSQDEDDTTPLPSQPISRLPSPPMMSRSESLLMRPTDLSSEESRLSNRRPSIYSVDSPFGGSTVCATPASGLDHKDDIEDLVIKETPSVTSFEKKLDPSSYAVETIGKFDDAGRIPRWKSRLYRLSPLTTILAMAAYLLYYIYRVHCTLDAQREFHQTYIMAWIFISAEGCVAYPTLFHQGFQILSIRGRRRAKLRLQGSSVPTVDVFITCCKEDIDVVLDTARAACSSNYPADRFRVVILDDGKDEELKKAIGDLSLEHQNLYYHARTKIAGVPHHFKAGNLSGGTDFVTRLDGGAGEYIAALDADMIPEPDWLRALVAHVVDDDRLAIACLPQMFYNIPENDPLCQSLDAFIHVMEPTKDANGVAWCTGSGYVIRRKALEAIGGWPVGSLAEDVYTSSLLLGSGWKTAYCHEALQFGTVPDTLLGHLKQRTRWTLGTMQTAVKLNFCLYGKMVRRMSIVARFSAAVFAIDALFKVFLPIALLAIPVVLISGGQLVAFTSYAQLRWKIRLCFISLMLSRLNEWVSSLPSGYRLAQRDIVAQMWMAPFHAQTVIRGFLLPSWLGGTPMAFSSSGSIKSELNERDAETRAPLFRRLKVVLWDYALWAHLFYASFLLVAICRSTILGITSHGSSEPRLMYLFTHAFWPPMLWLLAATGSLTPIRYAVWPPNMPDREALLSRDPKTGIARPKEEWKRKRYSKKTFWHESQISGITMYVAGIFLGSFFV